MGESYRRILQREWTKANPNLPKSTSLPRLKAVSPARPLFTCPKCHFSNELLPLCLWCGATSDKAAASFRASTPPIRRASSPPKVVWGGPPIERETPRQSLDSTVSCSTASSAPPQTPTEPYFLLPTVWDQGYEDLGELSVIREITEMAEEQQRAYEKAQMKKTRRKASIAISDAASPVTRHARSRSGASVVSRVGTPVQSPSRPTSPTPPPRPASPTLTWLIAHGGSRPRSRQPSQHSAFSTLRPYTDPISTLTATPSPAPSPAPTPAPALQPTSSGTLTLRRKGRFQRTLEGIKVTPAREKSKDGPASPRPSISSPLTTRDLNIGTIRPHRSRPAIPAELTSQTIYRTEEARESDFAIPPQPPQPAPKQRMSLRGLKFMTSRKASHASTTAPTPSMGFSMSGEVEMRMRLAAMSPDKSNTRFQTINQKDERPRNVIHRWFKSLRNLRPSSNS